MPTMPRRPNCGHWAQTNPGMEGRLECRATNFPFLFLLCHEQLALLLVHIFSLVKLTCILFSLPFNHVFQIGPESGQFVLVLFVPGHRPSQCKRSMNRIQDHGRHFHSIVAAAHLKRHEALKSTKTLPSMHWASKKCRYSWFGPSDRRSADISCGWGRVQVEKSRKRCGRVGLCPEPSFSPIIVGLSSTRQTPLKPRSEHCVASYALKRIWISSFCNAIIPRATPVELLILSVYPPEIAEDLPQHHVPHSTGH